MKKMLFETTLSGHRLEYIHHVYMGMIVHPEEEFVIVVPKEFEQRKCLYAWPKADNVKFEYLSENVLVNDNSSGYLRRSFRLTNMLRKHIKREQVDNVFLISLMGYITGLPFFISHRVRVSGIIYSIYLYSWRDSPWKRRLQDVCKYLIMKLTPCLKSVFILNDEKSARRLNELYLSHKFKFISDPFNALNYQPRNIRQELGVGVCDRLFLHFGGMTKRKGTLDILQAVALLPEDVRRVSVFVFAGRVYESIKEEFDRIKLKLPADVRVHLYDKFCSNEFLVDLCVSSDFILAPYHEINRSSGLLGYSAQYGTPMIGPGDGLIGALIRRYRLGETLREVTAACIAEKVCEVKPYRIESEYKERIKPQSFVKAVFEEILK